MASDSASRDFAELNFVDHYETKIQSPEKEMISPTKEVIKPLTRISGTSLGNDNIEKTLTDSTDEEEDVKEKKTDESDLDSGLDSSDNASAENEIIEKFVDRQEDIVHAEKPDILNPKSTKLEPSLSTSRIVDELFNFIDEENITGELEEQNENVEEKETIDISNNNRVGDVDWSLDAVNNNSEEVVKSVAEKQELRTEPKTENEFILTSKTEPKVLEDNVHLVPDTPGDSNMTLYWYSTNLELDANEIQEFNNPQEDEESMVGTSTGDGYYRDKMVDSKLLLEDQIMQTEDKNINLKTDSNSSDRWSPIYESASSRFLDLASELKTQPSADKSDETSVPGEKTLDHPWGLETENKVLLDSENKHEELPLIEPKFHPITDTSPDSLQDKNSVSSNIRLNFHVRKNVDLKQFGSEVANGKTGETSEFKMSFKTEESKHAIDQTDATGSMEIKDRDLIKSQEVVLEKLSPDMVLETGSVETETKESSDIKTSDLTKPPTTADQPDITGQMEVVDRENIKAQIGNILHVELSEKDIKNEDNLKKKSDEKIVTEQFEKGDVEVLQVGKQDSIEQNRSKMIAVRDAVDINTLEASIFQNTTSKSLKDDKHDGKGGNEDEVDAAFQENKAEVSHNVEVQVQNVDIQPSQTDISKVVILKHEPVEVKRKFKVGDDAENLIVGKGGKLDRTDIFVDQYFDDSCYTLTLNDSWFRKRHEKFELKTSCSAILSGGRVLADERIIIQSLQRILSRKSKLGLHGTISEVVSDLGLTEFATFQTTRRYYQLNACTLALDLTDFGFQSGDIQITVDHPTKVPDAIQTIDNLAKDLGFQLLQGQD